MLMFMFRLALVFRESLLWASLSRFLAWTSRAVRIIMAPVRTVFWPVTRTVLGPSLDAPLLSRKLDNTVLELESGHSKKTMCI